MLRSEPRQTLRRKRQKQFSAWRIAGLAAPAVLCVTYICFLNRSTIFVQDGVRRRPSHARRMNSIGRRLPSPHHIQAGTFRFQPTQKDTKLLLASHNRLLWYHYITGKTSILHQYQGVYYGNFPGTELDATGRPTSLWVVSRPHNWHPTETREHLLQLDMTTGKELGAAVHIDSRFTHDAIRWGNKVYVCSTERGALLELSLPDMKQNRTLELFTRKEHLNSVTPFGSNKALVLLHNHGNSQVATVDLTEGRVLHRFKGIGRKSHGLVWWQGSLLVLNSEDGALIRVNPFDGSWATLYQVPEGGKFLKGLAVIDDTAFFGVSIFSKRQERGDKAANSQLAAFCLRSMTLLWRRQVATKGLLNMVSAPHLAVGSTYAALEPMLPRPHPDTDGARPLQDSTPYSERSGSTDPANSSPAQRTAAMTHAKFPAAVDGLWGSGQPRMDIARKHSRDVSPGIQLLLARVDVSAVQAAFIRSGDAIWHQEEQKRSNAFFAGRGANMAAFKPGVEAAHLIFSDRQGTKVFQFPWFHRFAALVEPLVDQVIGRRDSSNIIRMQFARMRPGTRIKPHRDSGLWAMKAHRIHIPITASPTVGFWVCPHINKTEQRSAASGAASERARVHHLSAANLSASKPDCWPIILEEGQAFEINNGLLHQVENNSNVTRIHLIIDVAETPRGRTLLPAGTVCHYTPLAVACPPQVTKAKEEHTSVL